MRHRAGRRNSVQFPQVRGYLYETDSILSPDGHCRAFDARAQGTVSGNGGAVVVLKRLADALKENDAIYAVIRGSAVNNDGAEKSGYTAPSVRGQMRAIYEAQAVAGCRPIRSAMSRPTAPPRHSAIQSSSKR